MPDPVREIPKLTGVLKPVKAHVAELLADVQGKVRAVLEEEIARLQAVAAELGPEETTKADRADSGSAGPYRDAAKTIDAAEASQIAVQNAAARVEHDILPGHQRAGAHI